MPGLISGGKAILVGGLDIRNFKDEPKLALRLGKGDGTDDGQLRSKPVSLIVLHTTKGIPGGKDKREQVILPGFGPDTKAEDRSASYWSTDPTPSGAHIVVDHDGSVGCLADLRNICAYHAGQHDVNQRSIGIEIFQGSNAELYEEQLNNVVKLVNALTAEFSIQRQIPLDYRNKPVGRLQLFGGADLVGVVGHRDVSDQRGKGDPGDAIMKALEKAGYERFDFFVNQDKAEWKRRQQLISDKIGKPIAIDGVPGIGTQTTNALRSLGYQNGLWVLPPATGALWV